MRWGARADFKARVMEWAEKLGVPGARVSMRSMTTKWASCSTSGQLTFNAELLDLDKELSDYVIVHEMLHFRVPNHGKLWKALMKAHLGDYERLEARLPSRPAPARMRSRRKRPGAQRIVSRSSPHTS